jgi:hypothetical protein
LGMGVPHQGPFLCAQPCKMIKASVSQKSFANIRQFGHFALESPNAP